ncbi:hypothetical protein [Bradyrhizobium sp. USDA 4451]
MLRSEEFQGKIEAAVAKRDPDFLMITGTEALIARLGEAEALRRAQAFVEASADMILIHSKTIIARSKALCVLGRNRCRWSSCRILTPSGSRALRNVRMMIYGNYGIRGSATAMQETLRRIVTDSGVRHVGKDTLPLGGNLQTSKGMRPK